MDSKMKTFFSLVYLFILNLTFSQTQNAQQYNCVKNDTLSIFNVDCIDCYKEGELMVRKWTGVYIDEKVYDDDNKKYIENKFPHGLYGEYKDGKPYSSFFRNYNISYNSYLIFDYYENGKLAYQLYNDFFEGIIEGRDIGMDTRVLYKKNIFKDNKIWTGSLLYPNLLSWKGARVMLATSLKESKEKNFTMLFAAIHYGEIITVSNLKNGYYFDSFGKGKVRIAYSPSGRKIEFLDFKEQFLVVVDNQYEEFNEITKQEELKKGNISYFFMNNHLYINKKKYESEEELIDLEKGEDITTALLELINDIPYIYTPITTEDVINYFEQGYWIKPKSAFYFYLDYDGKPYGIDIEEGTEKGTYTIIDYTDEKTKNIIKDQTPEEIINYLNKILKSENDD